MNAREDLLRYLIRYGGICRDCADENGVCPQTGIGCGERRKATEFFVEALEYGTKYGFAAGYRLVATGELDAETVERCALLLERQPSFGDGKWAARHLRSLTPGSMEGQRE